MIFLRLQNKYGKIADYLLIMDSVKDHQIARHTNGLKDKRTKLSDGQTVRQTDKMDIKVIQWRDQVHFLSLMLDQGLLKIIGVCCFPISSPCGELYPCGALS